MFRVWTYKMGACVVTMMLGLSAAAEAATVGFQVRVGGGRNAPIIRLINMSTDAEITEFKMTIGKTEYNFDYFWLKTSPTMTYNMLTPDEINGGARFDELHATFTGFGAGEWFRIKTDLDVDNVDGNKENWHKILYDVTGGYGAALYDLNDNAEFHVKFSTGHEMEGYLKDRDVEKKRIRYTRLLDLPSDAPPPAVVVPLPAAVWSGFALMGGLGGIGFARRTWKRIF